MDCSTIKITLKKVRGNNKHFSTSEITPKKVRGNDVDFSTIEITSKNTWERRGFFDHEITSKKYVEMTWKFVEIWSSTYRCNIEVESTRFDGCVRWESFSTFWYSHKIIKSTSDIFSNFLYVGINSSIKSSVFPSCLKTADIRVSTRKGKETWKITIGL